MIYKLNGIGYDSNTYIIKDKVNIMIDPGTEGTFDIIKEELRKLGIKNIDYIINTHCHYDHSGSDCLWEDYFNSPIVIHDNEYNDLKNGTDTTVYKLFNVEFKPPKNIVPLSDVLDELESYGLKFIHTPGHTYGSISIIFNDVVFTGDTLFAYGVGRWDFPTGNLIDLKKSINILEKICHEQNITKIYPGHGEIGDMSAFINARLFV